MFYSQYLLECVFGKIECDCFGDFGVSLGSVDVYADTPNRLLFIDV